MPLNRSTDVSEGGLEALIVGSLTGRSPTNAALADEGARFPDRDKYIAGHRDDFDRTHALDVVQLVAFLRRQPPRPGGPAIARCR